MSTEEAYQRYRELQAYVGWADDDAARVNECAARLDSHLVPIVEDFYEEVERHEATRRIMTGGPAQIQRLKGTLVLWLRQLLQGPYDEPYVIARRRVGLRHSEIGLDQVFTNAALSRIRDRLLQALSDEWTGEPEAFRAAARSLNKLLDLDLAIIEDAYQDEHLQRRQRIERLAAIGQVAGGVAHELRNPLNVIKTSAYYLMNARSPTPAKTAEHMQRIERHVELADNVITALSNFARMPVPDARPVDLRECLKRTLEANPLPPGIAVVVECPEGLPSASADPQQLEIVFGNLVRNARDAMPSGGTLTLTVAAAGEDAVEVTVADTGIGIAPADLARITEPLYTTKARGLGLGLAIARAILDKNRGGLRVVSEPGRGTAFTVRLAAAPPESRE